MSSQPALAQALDEVLLVFREVLRPLDLFDALVDLLEHPGARVVHEPRQKAVAGVSFCRRRFLIELHS